MKYKSTNDIVVMLSTTWDADDDDIPTVKVQIGNDYWILRSDHIEKFNEEKIMFCTKNGDDFIISAANCIVFNASDNSSLIHITAEDLQNIILSELLLGGNNE